MAGEVIRDEKFFLHLCWLVTNDVEFLSVYRDDIDVTQVFGP